MRSVMIAGLLLNILAYFLMGPAPWPFGAEARRSLETGALMVGAQMLLGVANALTLITAFPFFEGAIAKVKLSGGTSLSKRQRIAVAGTWYNCAYSLGCGLGPVIAGRLNTSMTFQTTVMWLCTISAAACAVVCLEGLADRGATGAGVRSQPALVCLGALIPRCIDTGGILLPFMAKNFRIRPVSGEQEGAEEVEDEDEDEDEDEGEGWLGEKVLGGMIALLVVGLVGCGVLAVQEGVSINTHCAEFYADGWCDGTCAAASTAQAKFCDGDAMLSVSIIAPLTRAWVLNCCCATGRSAGESL